MKTYSRSILVIITLLAMSACNPGPGEIAQLPTLAVLPSITPTITPTFTPSQSPAPSETPTPTSSATITDTPPPTYTLLPTATRRPTVTPTEVCDAFGWFSRVTDFSLKYLLVDEQEIRQAYNEFSSMTYPSCVAVARANYLNYLNENLQFWVSLNRGDYEVAGNHTSAASQHFLAYMDEVHQLMSSSQSYSSFADSVNSASSSSGSSGTCVTLCNDGTCSSSTGRGTCSHHGGIRR